ncbi:MAG: ABC transporter substrate-binding protein [Actinomycetota bacterium]
MRSATVGHPNQGRRPWGIWCRSVVACLLLATVVAACGDDDSETAADPVAADTVEEDAGAAAEESDGTAVTTDGSEESSVDADDAELRVVQTSFGEVEVPVDPERIIALDAIAAVNLLSVGVRPTTVFDISGAASVRQVLAEIGIDVRDDLGDGFTEINAEAIAAEDPDLIVIVAVEGFDELLAPLAGVAPLVVLPFGSTWQDAVTDVGLILGEEERAAAVVAGIENRFAEVGEAVSADPYSLSILGSTFGLVFSMAPEAAVSITASELGVPRPSAQVENYEEFPGQPIIRLSEEVLGEHDADYVAVLDGQFYDSASVLDLPTFQTLPAVRGDRVLLVEGDLWFSGHPFAVFWQLLDLEALAGGDGADDMGTIDDALDRWDAYVDLTGV